MGNEYAFCFKSEQIIIDKSWERLFEDSKAELKEIEKLIGEDNTPEIKNIFKVFLLPIDKIKVIILGQDPYPQKDEDTGKLIATGRAFEINEDYNNWQKPIKNTSLINILKELYRQKDNGDKKKRIAAIREEIKKNKIISPNLLFKKWEENGVFLFNTALTCKIGEPKTHKIFWKDFTKKTIQYIASQTTKKYWLLWGNEAQEYTEVIKLAGIQNIPVPAVHPARIEFIGSETFKDVSDYCKITE